MPDSLACHTQHVPDFLKRVLVLTLQTKVQTKNLGITSLEGIQRTRDRLSEEASLYVLLRLSRFFVDEPLNQLRVLAVSDRAI